MIQTASKICAAFGADSCENIHIHIIYINICNVLLSLRWQMEWAFFNTLPLCQFSCCSDVHSPMYFPDTVVNDHLVQKWLPPSLVLPVMLYCVFRVFFFFFARASWRKSKKPTPVIFMPKTFWCLNRSLKECRWRSDVWNAHTHTVLTVHPVGAR